MCFPFLKLQQANNNNGKLELKSLRRALHFFSVSIFGSALLNMRICKTNKKFKLGIANLDCKH